MIRNLAPGDLVKKAWDVCNQDWPGCSIMNVMHLKVIVFLGGHIVLQRCMSKVMFNPSLLNWSSGVLTVAHIYICIDIYIYHLYMSMFSISKLYIYTPFCWITCFKESRINGFFITFWVDEDI